MSTWISTAVMLPADGLVVETKIDDAKGCRNDGRLKRLGNLWFLDDGSMYVYYAPTHWREVALEAAAQRHADAASEARGEGRTLRAGRTNFHD